MTETLGLSLPRVAGPLPGGRGTAYVERLAETECPAFTARRKRRAEASGASFDPICWAEARGCNVLDVDGNRYVDLTSGFGVAALGHAAPVVVEAITAQAGRLLHALGDVHPSDVKVALLEALAALAPFSGARTLLCATGADAVEAALKTAALATGRPTVLAFEGGYHGLSHGPLAACGYSEAFRRPFAAQLNPHVRFAPFPRAGTSLDAALASLDAVLDDSVGAVLVEPIQGRGGVHLPPPGYLAALSARAHARGAVVIADEIFVGLRRTGPMLVSVAEGLEADVLCLGKALAGGMPLSACIGRPEVMRAWGDPAGEALHTGTFFGHPLGCAAALASLRALEALDAAAIEAHGAALAARLRAGLPHASVRQRGLLLGVDLGRPGASLAVVRGMLERGFLALPAGADASVVQLVPPLVTPPALLDAAADALVEAAAAAGGGP